MKKIKQKSISWLKKEADKVFSRFIRKRDPRCITCHAPTTQAGHYVPRSWLGLRYDERNVNGQCWQCNVAKKGNLDVYTLYLIKKYGKDILERLNKLKVPTQFRWAEYERIIKKYKSN